MSVNDSVIDRHTRNSVVDRPTGWSSGKSVVDELTDGVFKQLVGC